MLNTTADYLWLQIAVPNCGVPLYEAGESNDTAGGRLAIPTKQLTEALWTEASGTVGPTVRLGYTPTLHFGLTPFVSI